LGFGDGWVRVLRFYVVIIWRLVWTVRQIGVPTDGGSNRAIRQDSQLLELCVVNVSLVVTVAEMVPRFAQ